MSSGQHGTRSKTVQESSSKPSNQDDDDLLSDSDNDASAVAGTSSATASSHGVKVCTNAATASSSNKKKKSRRVTMSREEIQLHGQLHQAENAAKEYKDQAEDLQEQVSDLQCQLKEKRDEANNSKIILKAKGDEDDIERIFGRKLSFFNVFPHCIYTNMTSLCSITKGSTRGSN
jgi:translation initiation factor 2 beta subunit (eIF-2beta)/eIF-5